jgi:hypothetical protein
MKQLSLVIIFLISISGISQTYTPFPKSNAVWNEVYFDTHNGLCQNSSIYIVGDTIINGKKYQRLASVNYLSFISNNCVGGYNFNTSNRGYYRNDTINKKVWYLNPQENVFSDTLLFDFSLQVGDTLSKLFYTSDYNSYFIDSIDYVNYGGVLRKRLFIKDHSQSAGIPLTYMIEGIGSSRGLFQSLGLSLCCYSQLNCFSQNSSSVFPDSITNCGVITNLNEINKRDEFILYPNPSKGLVHISSYQIIQSVRIYNFQGQFIKSIIPSTNHFELPAKTGMFLIQIEDINGNVTTKKVIRS